MAILDIVFSEYDDGCFEIDVADATYTIAGQVLNNLGAAQSGVVVKAFLTSTDQFVAQATSDGSGNYSITTPYFANHYIVAYYDTVTDQAGTTVNNIMPTP